MLSDARWTRIVRHSCSKASDASAIRSAAGKGTRTAEEVSDAQLGGSGIASEIVQRSDEQVIITYIRIQFRNSIERDCARARARELEIRI